MTPEYYAHNDITRIRINNFLKIKLLIKVRVIRVYTVLHSAMSQIGPVRVHLTNIHGPIKMTQSTTKR